MKNKFIVSLFISSTLLLLTGCCLSHDFSDATCTVPPTCNKCGEIQGDVVPHTFVDATCTEPKTCSVCNTTEGDALGHTWNDATCTTAKTCSVCNMAEGEKLAHQWQEATYEAPKTCALCGLTEGTVKEAPTPESITPQSPVEDMIAAYPDEITPERQAKLDEIKAAYEEGILPEELYKEDIYNTLYGPTREELLAEIERLLGEASEYSYTPYTETGDPEAFEALITG